MLKLFMKDYHAIGVMSGTSLDGVDIVYCSFSFLENWNFSIHFAECIAYDKFWTDKLNAAHKLSGYELILLHNEYGNYLGKIINTFIKNNKIKKVDCVASHGHTIFHQPESKITFQLGAGSSIAATTKQKVVSDFRDLDVQLSGQGAPLVPFGDRWLFYDYDYCLNLGGIANISYEKNKTRIGGDITFANMASNYLSSFENKLFDENGNSAAKGKVNMELLKQLNTLPFLQLSLPKSLGKEDFDNWFKPVLDQSTISISDKLATLTTHLGKCISDIVSTGETVLITGGGAHNTHWVKSFKNDFSINCILPNTQIIDYKEALIFAFLGILRVENKPNIYKSVTGANKDSIGGVIHHG